MRRRERERGEIGEGRRGRRKEGEGDIYTCIHVR